MLLLLEIILTIFAWRNGWKWSALLPIGITFILGYFIGYAIASSGGSLSDANWVVLIDIASVIVLIVMVVKKPKSISIDKK